MHSDVSKRDIVEDCVFAWHGADLILLPCNSVEYQESVEYTAKQDLKISAKELVPGRQYNKKKSDEILTYLGKFDWWEFKSKEGKWGDDKKHINKGKKHIFWNGSGFFPTTPSVLASVVSEDIIQDYPNLLDKFFGTIHSQPIKAVKIVPYAQPIDDTSTWKEYPVVGRCINNTMEQISTRRFYTSAPYTFETAEFKLYTKRVSFADSIDIDVVKQDKSTYYGYRSYDTVVDITKDFRPKIYNQAFLNGYDFKALLPSQYAKIMTDLGYGEFRYVLQNDNEVEVRSYY